MTEINITLSKAKYRRQGKLLHRDGIDPPGGTWTYNAGRFKSKSSNAGTANKAKAVQGNGPRRKIYLGFTGDLK